MPLAAVHVLLSLGACRTGWTRLGSRCVHATEGVALESACVAKCASVVTLETLDLTPGTWRATFNSTVIRPCVRSSGCMGGPGNATSSDSDSYCGTGYR